MLFILAAAFAGSTPQLPPRSPARASVEARATVRIVAGARLHLADGRGRDGFTRRDAIVHTDGRSELAKLVEFE